MNKIQKLINQLCPDGVEFKELGEVCEIKNWYTPSKSKKEYWENWIIPWFRLEDIRTNWNILNDSIQHISKKAVKWWKLFPANSIIMSTTATIWVHALITSDFIMNQQLTAFSIKDNFKNKLDYKFLFYYSFIIWDLCRKNINPGGFALIWTTK